MQNKMKKPAFSYISAPQFILLMFKRQKLEYQALSYDLCMVIHPGLRVPLIGHSSGSLL